MARQPRFWLLLGFSRFPLACTYGTAKDITLAWLKRMGT